MTHPNGLTTQYGTEGTWKQRQDTLCGNSGLIPSRPLGRNLPLLVKSKMVTFHVQVAAITNLPSSTLPDSPFIRALGDTAAQNVPPQTGTLTQRALEKQERTLCENKAVAILAQMQAGWLALIQKDGREMLIDLAVRFTQRPLQIRLVTQWQL